MRDRLAVMAQDTVLVHRARCACNAAEPREAVIIRDAVEQRAAVLLVIGAEVARCTRRDDARLARRAITIGVVLAVIEQITCT